ncbi:MAG: histidine kinase [Ancalomicrobiaceae bacterium]|nr:histidine kinase [Ancalomicrobiaceae bacterium]
MPTLFRFLLSLAVLSGIVVGSMYSLATFVQPKPREITIRVPQDRFLPQQPQ